MRDCPMPDDPALVRVIHQAIADARGVGLDYVGQTQQGVRAVLRVRPDFTPLSATMLVERVRSELAG